ncbi:MAG: biotin/lipoyl-containing protein, partial [Vulcanimicrobiaceae bacterium]
MATTITMPQLGETVTEGTVAQWLKSVGDSVDKYEDFVEVSTDKVNAGVPSPVTGVIKELLVKEGETVATGTPIAVIEDAGGAASAPAKAKASAAAPPVVASDAIVQERPAPATPSANGSSSGSATETEDQATALRGASPAVRRLAREHNVDIRGVRGSGSNGRVTADDVLGAAKGGATSAPPAAPAP